MNLQSGLNNMSLSLTFRITRMAGVPNLWRFFVVLIMSLFRVWVYEYEVLFLKP